MHNRFINPHQNFQNPNTRQDQYVAGYPVNPGGNMPQQYQGGVDPRYANPNQQYQPVDPRGMNVPVYYDPNTGQTLVPVNALPMGQMQQPMQGQQPMQMPQAYRPANAFSQGVRNNPTIPQGGLFMQQQQQDQTEGVSNRFKDDNTQRNDKMQQPITPVANAAAQFVFQEKIETIDLSISKFRPVGRYVINKKTGLTVNVPTADQLIASHIFLEDIQCVSSHYEAIESLTEKTDSKLISMDCFVTTNFHDADHRGTLSEMFKDDIKQCYRMLEKAFESIKNESEYILFNYIDERITGLVNDFLMVNLEEDVRVDSFVEDFHLLQKNKIFQANLELNSKILDYLDAFVENVKHCGMLDIVIEEENAPYTVFTVKESFIYVGFNSAALFPLEKNGKFRRVVYNAPHDSSTPLLIKIATEFMKPNSNVTVITNDREEFELITSADGVLYIR
jgi:hypothetical protein